MKFNNKKVIFLPLLLIGSILTSCKNIPVDTSVVPDDVETIYKKYSKTDKLYLMLAKRAVKDNLNHFWQGDTLTGFMHPTHSGYKLESKDLIGPIWETAMVMYGVYDLYTITKEEEYKSYLIAQANYYKNICKDNPKRLEDPVGWPGPATDDCAWAAMMFLSFYEVNNDEWYKERVINLLDNCVERWYDENLGAMYYKDNVDYMSLYECGMTLSWLRLHEITNEQRFYDLALRSYDGLHNALYSKKDGLYYCEANSYWPLGDLKSIAEGGSASFIAGNMAMATLAAKLYKITNDNKYLDRVYEINAGLLKRYYKDGYLIADRDAWTNGTFAAYYAGNVLCLENNKEMQNALLSNADSIMKNARTEDGYYDGSWGGPAGKSVWSFKKSMPQQITTSGSSVSMVTSAAILEAKISDFNR